MNEDQASTRTLGRLEAVTKASQEAVEAAVGVPDALRAAVGKPGVVRSEFAPPPAPSARLSDTVEATLAHLARSIAIRQEEIRTMKEAIEAIRRIKADI